MSLVINTNVSSLLTQNNLGKSQSALAAATQRLSSGLRINGAADDAAGFAISQRYTTQIGGLAQASANASDAINLAQTTSSSLDEVTANLQAVRDLAAQSANGTYTDADRATIDNEVQQRLAEVTRIANQTTFNGKKVLDGSLQSQSFQIGANVGQTVSVSLGQSVKAGDLGKLAEVTTGDISAAFKTSTGLKIAAGDLKVGAVDVAPGTYTSLADLGSAITAAAFYTTGNNFFSIPSGDELQFVNAAAATVSFSGPLAGQLGLTTIPTGSGATSGASALLATVNPPLDLSGEGLSINGNNIDLSGVDSLQGVSDAINAKGVEGVSAAVSGDGKGINFYSNGALTVADTGGNVLDANAKDANDAGNAVASGSITAGIGGSLSGGSVGTVDGANELISRIDVALDSVAGFAARLGAVQNRFQSTLATLSSQSTNLKASQSTIQDADFAAETASLSKAQVLQQAGISVLSQANSNPQQVLKLLQ